MKTPDITTAQIVAVAQSVIGLAVAFGAPITTAQATAIVAVVSGIAGVLLVSDAVIRNGRSRIAAAQVAAGSPPAGGKAIASAGAVPPPAGAIEPPDDLGARLAAVESQLIELQGASGRSGD